MDAPLKELSKLEKLTGKSSGKGKTTPVTDSLDSLLQALYQTKTQHDAGILSAESLEQLAQTVEAKKRDVDDRQKEIYTSVARIGKALDKKFPVSLPSYPNLFTSEKSVKALERTIAHHFLRTGQFETAQIFMEESNLDIPPDVQDQFMTLNAILKALKSQNIGPALEWAQQNSNFLRNRSSPLEFHLHRSQYIRLLLSSHPPNPDPAIQYARAAFKPFLGEHQDEIKRLMTCILFLPISKLQTSPYSDLASPSLHFDLEPMFAREYCASLGMSKQLPLRVVGDIGAGGALAKIEKGRRIMRERKSEWHQTDELLIEVPLAPENRYHSIFTCPVSKEQSTEQNPPMMMTCGHVISRDSLQKLSKAGGRLKCPYCPAESEAKEAVSITF
ncbi:CTLH/CRA C-terminal to lish motif domain-containing protein [Mycena floridula]|nr:CTLH/CRA C-terminal to lish motif domain-containing protein [Mycena floridula]